MTAIPQSTARHVFVRPAGFDARRSIRRRALRRAVLRAVGDRSEFDTLDLGCGYHAALLRALGPRLRRGVGVDVRVSDNANTSSKLSFLEATIESALPTIETASFDVVLMISVLEHLWEPLDALRECRRVLSPGRSLTGQRTYLARQGVPGILSLSAGTQPSRRNE